VPLWSFEGTALDCGKAYAERTLREQPDFRRWLDASCRFLHDLSGEARRMIEAAAPHLIDLHRGLAEAAGPPATAPAGPTPSGCTSFGVHGSLTLDGLPISGQTKDTGVGSANRYVALRLRMTGAPTILTLAYPGEVLGYGMWSTGSSLFRNSLHSRADAKRGLSMVEWGFLALACESVHAAVEIALQCGIRDAGNCLLSDREGNSLSVEFNAGGVSVVPAKAGIATHANHPEGERTAAFEQYPDEADRLNSYYRMHGLWNLLYAERGRLSPARCFHLLSDHTGFPGGICRHTIEGRPGLGTTAAVVAEPTRGRLHVARGNPCCNWPASYGV
jgi:hypothetical protein